MKYKRYEELLQDNPERIMAVDASAPLDAVVEEMIGKVEVGGILIS